VPPATGVIVNLTPGDVTVLPGSQKTFTAIVSGSSNTQVTWEYGAGGTSGNSNTVTYTAPNTPGRYFIKAISVADPSKSASVNVDVSTSTTPVVKVTLDPPSSILQSGQQQCFTANVAGTPNTKVTWEYGGGGTSGSGNTTCYTAPTTPGTYFIKATSVADSFQSAAANITVVSQTAGVVVSISPQNAVIRPGVKQTFTATVTGASNTDVSWALAGLPAATGLAGQGSSGQSINALKPLDASSATSSFIVNYIATGDKYTLSAISLADDSKKAIANISFAP
jgi:hypothetical protein